MDPDNLRLILLGLGVVLMAGIYIAANRERWFGQHSIRRQREVVDDQALSSATLPEIVPDPAFDASSELLTLQASREIPSMDVPVFAASSDMPASSASLPAEPELIITLQVVTQAEPFQAAAIIEAAELVELVYADDLGIYQRVQGDSQQIVFSVANFLEPGTLPGSKDTDFCTPGLVLFAVLPGALDGLAMFSDLVLTAERIASHLSADVLGDDRKPLTRQSMQFMRDKILEHRR
jgi:cell division protein ZipA